MNLQFLAFRLACIFLLILGSFSGFSQNTVDFRSPLGIPLYLSSNFAEIRTNHFHSGIDIKTQGVVGKNVYAIDDGYVSRISVSSGGYGKALYITHLNGYVSVYGHLKNFNEKITRYLRRKQYEQERFKVSLYLRTDFISVKKGEIIAQSGNTGFSGGPHLHFEIRDAQTEHPLNPLLFGFDVKDTKPPKILKIYLYPVGKNTAIDGKNADKVWQVQAFKGAFSLKGKKIPQVHGQVGFGIQAFDYANNSHNRIAPYSIELQVDSTTIYQHILNEFSFYETRDINSHIDYSRRIRHKTKIHRIFTAPNNRLSIYKQLKNRGVVEFTDGKIHHIKFIVRDVKGNQSVLKFKVKSLAKQPKLSAKKQIYSMAMPYDKANYVIKKDVRISIPKNGLYDSLFFTFSKSNTPNGAYSPVYQVHNTLTALRKPFTLSLKATQVPARLREKALIVRQTKRGWKAVGGKYINGFITAQPRSFGRFFIAVDSIAPSVTLHKFKANSTLKKGSIIAFKISDALSGIKSYKVYVDNKWLLFEYDAKTNILSYVVDNQLIKGSHNLRLELQDYRNNKFIYRTTFRIR